MATTLERLPQEIFDNIFVHLLDSWPSDNTAALVALRQQSRRLHHVTAVPFIRQIKYYLRESSFMLTFPSLGLLYHLSSLPSLRSIITSLTLVHSRLAGLECEHRWPVIDEECVGHELSPSDPMACLEHYLCWEERREEEEGVEAFYLLSEIFDNLKQGRSLNKLELEAGCEAALAALHATGMENHVTYVKKVWKGRNEPGRPEPPSVLQYLRAHGFRDRYTWDAAPAGPGLDSIMHQTTNGGFVTLNGQSADMRALWPAFEAALNPSVRDSHFQAPHTLSLYDVSVHGGLLKRFLKRQEISTRLDLIHVKLTAGSWRKIFIALKQRSGPDYLSLACLYQKARDGRVKAERPGKAACPANRIGCSKNKIEPFLEKMCAFFRLRVVGGDFWYEVELLAVPGLSYENAIDAPVRMELNLNQVRDDAEKKEAEDESQDADGDEIEPSEVVEIEA